MIDRFIQFLINLATLQGAWAIGIQIAFWVIIVIAVIMGIDAQNDRHENSATVRSYVGIAVFLGILLILSSFIVFEFTNVGKRIGYQKNFPIRSE